MGENRGVENDQVRIELFALSSKGVRRPGKVKAIAAGIDEMSDIEARYWYAKCIGSSRGARALRVLVAS